MAPMLIDTYFAFVSGKQPQPQPYTAPPTLSSFTREPLHDHEHPLHHSINPSLKCVPLSSDRTQTLLLLSLRPQQRDPFPSRERLGNSTLPIFMISTSLAARDPQYLAIELLCTVPLYQTSNYSGVVPAGVQFPLLSPASCQICGRSY
jgi:hypothetical protein